MYIYIYDWETINKYMHVNSIQYTVYSIQYTVYSIMDMCGCQLALAGAHVPNKGSDSRPKNGVAVQLEAQLLNLWSLF